MKKSIIVSAGFGILLAVAAVSPQLSARPVRAISARVTRPVPLRIPIQGDSTDASNPFEYNSLLKGRTQLKIKEIETRSVEADTAGFLPVVVPEGDAAMETFATRIRAEKYLKGKLKVTSVNRFEVLVNDIQKGSKTALDDSISDSSAIETELLFEPEQVHSVIVKVLSQSKDAGCNGLRIEFVPDAGYDSIPFVMEPTLRKRVDVDAVTRGGRVADVALSPDGKYLLTTFKTFVSEGDIRMRMQLSDAVSGRVLNSNMPLGSQWGYDGSTVYYTVNGVKGTDMYRMELPSMRTALHAEALPSETLYILPGARRMLYQTVAAGKAENGVMKRYRDKDDRIPGDRDRTYISMYDVETGVAQPLTSGGWSTFIADVSADGSRLLYMGQRQVPEYPFSAVGLYEMNLNTMAVDTLVASDPSLRSAIYSPDARRVFMTAGAISFDGLGANAGPHPIPNDFDTQGFVMDVSSRKITPLTRDFNPSLKGSGVWNSRDNLIYIGAADGFYNRVYTINADNGRISQLPAELESVDHFSVGRDEAARLAYCGAGDHVAGQAWMLNLKNRTNTLIADPMRAMLDDIDFGTTSSWRFTASDGTEIDGIMTLPPDFDPARKYPMIVYYYGGTNPTQYAFHHPYVPQIFASRGYVVYTVNPSGATGYGQEFSARHVNAWGKRTAEDIIEGTKEFVRQHPFVDSKKIGCLGASYGGFMTQYLQTLTDIFAAAVSHAGISNVASYWGEGYWGYSYNSVAAAKSYPWTDPELYTRQGSLFNADKIHTPLLLLHGTDDTNVPVGESIQLFNALKILGRQVEFITVEGQNHIIVDYNKRLLWHATIMAWFERWLKDDPRWWDSLYGK